MNEEYIYADQLMMSSSYLYQSFVVGFSRMAFSDVVSFFLLSIYLRAYVLHHC